MKKIIAILFTICMLPAVGGCKYDPLPPKTDNSSQEYLLPAGEVPSEAEMVVVNAAREEYEEATA